MLSSIPWLRRHFLYPSHNKSSYIKCMQICVAAIDPCQHLFKLLYVNTRRSVQRDPEWQFPYEFVLPKSQRSCLTGSIVSLVQHTLCVKLSWMFLIIGFMQNLLYELLVVLSKLSSKLLFFFCILSCYSLSANSCHSWLSPEPRNKLVESLSFLNAIIY